MKPIAFFLALLAWATVAPILEAQSPEKMPREDVVSVLAVGDGLCVHNLFQSHMVLQRDKPIRIWGWAAPGEKVSVTLAGRTASATAEKDRAWRVTLPSLLANSEPQNLIVTGQEETLTLENILIGDVWILGGQSNMEFPLDKVQNGKLEIVSAHYPKIRILTVPAQDGPKEKVGFSRLHEWSSWSSRHFRKGDWDVCSPEIARELSAIGYVFARRIHMATQIPIGVIDASRGGTTVETWTPTSVLKEIGTPEVDTLFAQWDEKLAAWDPDADLAKQIAGHKNWVEKMTKEGRPIPADRTVPTEPRPGPAMDQNRPGNCYASMIAPISGLAVKGAIFHQGFNNALGGGTEASERYHQIFAPMIKAWRSAFNDPEMPFGIISLCTAGDPQTRDDYVEKMMNDGIYIREAQYRTFLDLYEAGDQNIGFASSFDQRRSWYHPQLKLPIGERISRWALATQYGLEKDIKWRPPLIKETKVEAGQIVVKLDQQVRAVADGPMVGFAIAGEDRKFQPAEAEYLVTGKDDRNRPKTDKTSLVLTSPHVPEPVHFRYAWGRNPMANIQTTDHNDLPLATQRSDSWKMEQLPGTAAWDQATTPQDQWRRMKSQSQKALRLEDTKRRLDEAETFLKENRETYEKEKADLDAELEKRKAEAK